MSTDDPPKKPPRASWEPPDPDEVPAKQPVEKSGKTEKPKTAWTPPPLEPLPPKKPRAQTKPPRASWEAPDPDEAVPTKPASGTVSGSWTTEPSGPAGREKTPDFGNTDAYATSGSRRAPASTSGSIPPVPRTANYASSGSEAGASANDASSGTEAGASANDASSGTEAGAAETYASSGTFAAPSSGYASPGTEAGAADSDASGTAADGYASSGTFAAPSSGGYASSGTYASPSTETAGDYAQSGAYGTPSSDESGTSSMSGTSGPVVRPADSDDPMAPLPTIAEDNTLRSAVGAKLVKERKRPPPPPTFDDDDLDDEDGDSPKGSGRGKLIAIVASLAGVLGLGIGALIIFGNINKQRFMIACEPQEVHAKQGRGFPPWGERTIDDEGMWKPIKIPPEAECHERETEDQEELSRWYLDILVERASSMLTAREVTKIDDAAAMLDQALLHARSPDRREQRRDIERLLGDVGYWRASAKLKDASAALLDAAKQFDAAAAQRPRHVSDASAWATYVRKLAEELQAGPNGALTAFPPTPPVTPGREPAPPGVALPVEPPDAGSGSAEPPPAPPDAGLPTGGVLL